MQAPGAWQLGEQLRIPVAAWNILKSRELKIGGEGGDIALPGEPVPFGKTLGEYVPLLVCAIEEDRNATLRRLLELGVDSNGYFHGETPLGYAAALGRMECVSTLREYNAILDLPWVTIAGEPVIVPLHAAAARGHRNVVRFLLDSGADVEMPRGQRHVQEPPSLSPSPLPSPLPLPSFLSFPSTHPPASMLDHGADIEMPS